MVLVMQLDRLNEKLVKLPTEGVKGLEQGFHVVILKLLCTSSNVVHQLLLVPLIRLDAGSQSEPGY